MSSKLPIILAALITAAGCAHRAEHPREPVVVSPYGDWLMLGERWVEGTHDHDVIHVGAREGRFHRIMIVVEHSPLEMYDVAVYFGDGTVFAPRTRHVFAAETRSHVIELPGDRRVISRVEFRYGNLPGSGRAHAQLWAQ
ncbi:MAG TPA: hypothetical protein VMU50_07205 [Polyangia bacterium]|nr:hypothetical protein [Polyangia bacterium]